MRVKHEWIMPHGELEYGSKDLMRTAPIRAPRRVVYPFYGGNIVIACLIGDFLEDSKTSGGLPSLILWKRGDTFLKVVFVGKVFKLWSLFGRHKRQKCDSTLG